MQGFLNESVQVFEVSLTLKLHTRLPDLLSELQSNILAQIKPVPPAPPIIREELDLRGCLRFILRPEAPTFVPRVFTLRKEAAAFVPRRSTLRGDAPAFAPRKVALGTHAPVLVPRKLTLRPDARIFVPHKKTLRADAPVFVPLANPLNGES